jgi:hypothetical protein
MQAEQRGQQLENEGIDAEGYEAADQKGQPMPQRVLAPAPYCPTIRSCPRFHLRPRW